MCMLVTMNQLPLLIWVPLSWRCSRNFCEMFVEVAHIMNNVGHDLLATITKEIKQQEWDTTCNHQMFAMSPSSQGCKLEKCL